MTVLVADAKELLGDYLRNHADIVALDAWVSVKPPANLATPWVKLSEIGLGDRSAAPDHLMSHFLQFDCYARRGRDGGAVEANLLGRTVRAAIRELAPADVPGWTPSVITLNGPRDLGVDTNFEPARDRTMVEAEILLHRNVGS